MTINKSDRRFAVFTSGGDSPGMNAAVRAVVRTAEQRGVPMHAILEGYQGMVDGGDRIRRLTWNDVGGILQQGGTVIGSARCLAFRERAGRLRAARNLLANHIDGLIVIGGDGSLTGANVFRQEWPELLAELVERGDIDPALAKAHPHLQIVGMVGSIDNDMFGTDMTIGADTALHRIVDAIDTIVSTAASHHRTFIVEVMGRHCGYLALMGGLATGANWVLIPECPPDTDDWEEQMCDKLQSSRDAGRRHGVVVVAEGAQDRNGNPLSSSYIQKVIETRLGTDTRITILGHVQRGGAPSAFDRNLATMLGYTAVEHLLTSNPEDEPKLVGILENSVAVSNLMGCVEKTRSVAKAIAEKDYDGALRRRGSSFAEAWGHLRTLLRAMPRGSTDIRQSRRLAILHQGGPAPGMNTAVRAAARLAIDDGHTVLGIENGFDGLLSGSVHEMQWMSVHGWVGRGGAELGTSRRVPTGEKLERIAHCIEKHRIDEILMVGGWAGYMSAYNIYLARERYPQLRIPFVCLPATINNNLPGTEYAIGVDTALNSIVGNVDRIKQSAVATHRCFIVEVMGHDCGYLALVAGLATGAERVYLPEEGISLKLLQKDVERLVKEFGGGKRLGLFVRSENAEEIYTTDFIARLFEQEGGDVFDVRQSILGHTQQGGNPTPYDRTQAIRLAARAVQFLNEQAGSDNPPAATIGLNKGKVTFTSLEELPNLIHPNLQRPRNQRWLALRPIAQAMSAPQ